MKHLLPCLLLALLGGISLRAALPARTALPAPGGDRVLLEAESFQNAGGWSLDTQFIDLMGSPYLLAHGLGQPVADATTTTTFPSTGKYRVWVRTKDWVAHWGAPGAPGKFQVLVNGQPLGETFGTKGAAWFWHDGGTVEVGNRQVTVALRDLTGFEGRCDAVYFTKDLGETPPNDSAPLSAWRKVALHLPDQPEDMGEFDLVVVGGGYGGLGSALSAARMGLKVALIQNRPVLGGNGSSEVRVWAQGLIRRGKYPHIGEMIEEFADRAKNSPGTYEEFGDAQKEAHIRKEKNISLFLNEHVYAAETRDGRIVAVTSLNTTNSREKRFRGKFFSDCTGHGNLAHLAGAKYEIEMKDLLGMSNMWIWSNASSPQNFPETPWALDLTMDDFPYPKMGRADMADKGKGEWFWESGFNKHPINDLETIRDWNFRAVYGAFNAMKNKDGKAQHPNAKLDWIAYIGGTRESRRIVGDVMLTHEDIVNKRDFPDGCVPSTWSIDLHFPKQEFAKKFPDNPFISYADHDRRVDRTFGYPIPYRCLYSVNVANLFMAGRNISVTDHALGTVRVMKTIGMMGEVVGKAASIAVRRNCTPRDVYHLHWAEMDQLLKLPGRARRQADNTFDLSGPVPAPVDDTAGRGTSLASLKGIVIDNNRAKLTGKWATGGGLPHVGSEYAYARGPGNTATFEFTVPTAGRYEVRFATAPHENRASNTSVSVRHAGGTATVSVNQRVPGPIDDRWVSLGTWRFEAGQTYAVVVDAANANGNAHIDAVQVLPAN
ncbi:MAG: FAD-dependent oxidoreductase [Verrucomicrobia bacterium]|nr:FAD-dependent oxidoreductase [Verrucomicrobiota bacterium]